MVLTPPAPGTGALTVELAKVLGRIGRGLRYRTRAVREALEVTYSEGELLRLLGRQPGIRVHEAASELGVASNSVSTLVKQLTRAGLIQRGADPLDGRAACLRLTPLSEEWVTRVGNAREGAIDRALDSLDVADRALLEAAVPAMTRLAEALANPGGSAQPVPGGSAHFNPGGPPLTGPDGSGESSEDGSPRLGAGGAAR